MVYHRSRNDAACRSACGCAMLPLRTGSGPAPAEAGDQDVLDEVLSLLRANVLVRAGVASRATARAAVAAR